MPIVDAKISPLKVTGEINPNTESSKFEKLHMEKGLLKALQSILDRVPTVLGKSHHEMRQAWGDVLPHGDGSTSVGYSLPLHSQQRLYTQCHVGRANAPQEARLPS